MVKIKIRKRVEWKKVELHFKYTILLKDLKFKFTVHSWWVE